MTRQQASKLIWTSLESAKEQCYIHGWRYKIMDVDGLERRRPVYADPEDPDPDLVGLYVRGGFVYRVELPEDGWLGECELVNYGRDR